MIGIIIFLVQWLTLSQTGQRDHIHPYHTVGLSNRVDNFWNILSDLSKLPEVDIETFLPQICNIVLDRDTIQNEEIFEYFENILVNKCIDCLPLGLRICGLLKSTGALPTEGLFRNIHMTSAAALQAARKEERFNNFQDRIKYATCHGYTQQHAELMSHTNVKAQYDRVQYYNDYNFLLDTLGRLGLELRPYPVSHRNYHLRRAIAQCNSMLYSRMVTHQAVNSNALVESIATPGAQYAHNNLKTASMHPHSGLSAEYIAPHCPDIARHSLHLPLLHSKDKIRRILRFVESDCETLPSRDRCPYVVVVEVIDTQEGTCSQSDLYSPSSSGNGDVNHNVLDATVDDDVLSDDATIMDATDPSDSLTTSYISNVDSTSTTTTAPNRAPPHTIRGGSSSSSESDSINAKLPHIPAALSPRYRRSHRSNHNDNTHNNVIDGKGNIDRSTSPAILQQSSHVVSADSVSSSTIHEAQMPPATSSSMNMPFENENLYSSDDDDDSDVDNSSVMTDTYCDDSLDPDYSLLAETVIPSMPSLIMKEEDASQQSPPFRILSRRSVIGDMVPGYTPAAAIELSSVDNVNSNYRVDNRDSGVIATYGDGAIANKNSIVHNSIQTSNTITSLVASKTIPKYKEILRTQSPFGHLPGWDVVSFIVKTGDDVRKEVLAMQLIEFMQEIFQREDVDIYLRPYQIVCTGHQMGLIEYVEGTSSIDKIKKLYNKQNNNRYNNNHNIEKSASTNAYINSANGVNGVFTLREYFMNQYGHSYNVVYAKAVQNFIKSLVGYSLVTYLLQVKDRHNANILLDKEGHIVHIDFGFILGDSPGFNINFESAPFKFTREYLDLIGGIDSANYRLFEDLFVQGFLALQKHSRGMAAIIQLFYGDKRKNAADGLCSRLMFPATHTDIVSLVRDSVDNWRTKQYDWYQYQSNNIMM